MKKNSKSKSAVPVSAGASRPVDRLRSVMELLTTASVLSGQNLLVIGEPGFGKTSYLHNIARYMAGGMLEEGGGYLKVECDPSIRPSVATGHENLLYSLVEDPEEKGIPFWQYKRTARDPQVKLVLLNEVQRANSAFKGALLPIMDVDLNVFNRVVFWGDSNYLSYNVETMAFEDRFGIRAFIDSVIPDPSVVVHSKPSREWTFDVPDWTTIFEIQEALRDFRMNGEGRQSDVAIIQALRDIVTATGNTPFVMSPRRQTALMTVLYSMTVYETGENDFEQVSPLAWQAASYAYPALSPMDATLWRQTVMSCVDTVASAIAAFELNARKVMDSVVEQIAKERGLSVEQRRNLVTENVGSKLQEFQEELMRDYDENDPRVQDCISNLQAHYVNLYRKAGERER